MLVVRLTLRRNLAQVDPQPVKTLLNVTVATKTTVVVKAEATIMAVKWAETITEVKAETKVETNMAEVKVETKVETNTVEVKVAMIMETTTVVVMILETTTEMIMETMVKWIPMITVVEEEVARNPVIRVVKKVETKVNTKSIPLSSFLPSFLPFF
jgi:hypothetical protein